MENGLKHKDASPPLFFQLGLEYVIRKTWWDHISFWLMAMV
jgi:hypothetical protein